MTTRALAHYFLSMDARPTIAVFDTDGLSTQNSDVVLTQILDLSIEQGWINLHYQQARGLHDQDGCA